MSLGEQDGKATAYACDVSSNIPSSAEMEKFRQGALADIRHWTSQNQKLEAEASNLRGMIVSVQKQQQSAQTLLSSRKVELTALSAQQVELMQEAKFAKSSIEESSRMRAVVQQMTGITLLSTDDQSFTFCVSSVVKTRTESFVVRIALNPRTAELVSASVLSFLEGSAAASSMSPSMLGLGDLVKEAASRENDLASFLREARHRFRCGILRQDIYDALSSRYAIQGNPFENSVSVTFLTGSSAILSVPKDFPVVHTAKEKIAVASVKMRDGRIETPVTSQRLATINADPKTSDILVLISELSRFCL
eukprot:ANDGO_03712.mRNA.1 hypothetical protein